MVQALNKISTNKLITKSLLCLSLLPAVCFSQVLNGSFEINGLPSLDHWIINCNDSEPFEDAPSEGGFWCLSSPTGNLQGCFPRTAAQMIPQVSDGEILQVTVWARQDEIKTSQTSVYLKIFHTPDNVTILSADSTTSNEWVQLTVVDTLTLDEGDSVAIVLDAGMTSGPDILNSNSYFDLVDVEIIGKRVTSKDDMDDLRPKDFELLQNFPNPFNPETSISYNLAIASNVILKIFNLEGQLIRTLVNEYKPPGFYTVVWNGINESGISVPSGTYFYKIRTDYFRQIRKMVLLK